MGLQRSVDPPPFRQPEQEGEYRQGVSQVQQRVPSVPNRDVPVGDHGQEGGYQSQAAEGHGHLWIGEAGVAQVVRGVVLSADERGTAPPNAVDGNGGGVRQGQDENHQVRMMGEVAKLIGEPDAKLPVDAYERTAQALLDQGIIEKEPSGAWTSDITDAM